MKYDIDVARKEFLKLGYYLDAEEYINTSTKMPCHDDYGFKYLTNINSIRTKRKPYKFNHANPYSLYNIQLILDKETNGTKILDTVYKNANTKMKFVCECGNIFEMDLNLFNDGKRYCNYCSKSKRYDGLVDYQSLVEKECSERNYILKTDNLKRSNDVFEYICEKHHDMGIQTSTPYRLIKAGQGCKYCGIESRGIKHRLDMNDVIETVEKHGFQYVDYLYSKPNDKASSKLQIKCLCKKHLDKGIQIIDFQNLKNNTSGCVYCNGRFRTKESLQEEFDELNSGITILEFNSYSDITVKCNKCNNIWKTSGSNILQGHGCPRCKKSTYEKKIECILINNNINYIPQYKTAECKDKLPLPFDFYLFDHNIMLEIDGQGHYKPTNFGGISDEKAEENFKITKYHDNIKDNYCIDNSINLLRIPYFIIDNKNIDLEDYLLNNIRL